MEHHFNIEFAEKYGVDEAIMLNNFIFWISKNKANNKNYYGIEHNGEIIERYWTYNSVNAFSELFPYWSEKQIRRILISMENKGLIITGNFNKVNYDRTKWYALMDESILPFGQIEMTKKENRNDQKGEPIPYNKPDINTNNKLDKELISKVTNKFIDIYFSLVSKKPIYERTDKNYITKYINKVKKSYMSNFEDVAILFLDFMKYKYDNSERKFQVSPVPQKAYYKFSEWQIDFNKWIEDKDKVKLDEISEQQRQEKIRKHKEFLIQQENELIELGYLK